MAPSFGTKKPVGKKKVVLFAVGGAVGLGIVIWYKHSHPSTASGQGTDTTGQDPSIDPNTGVPYAEEYGYGGAGLSGIGLGAIDPNTGVPYAQEYGYATTPGGTTTLTFTSNAEWAQAAEAFLVSQNYNPVTVTGALGAYLAGLGLTQNQYNIVQAAIGFEGQPPNPPAPPHLTDGGGGSGQGSGGGGGGGTPPPPAKGSVTVPHCVNDSVNLAIGKLVTVGLKYKLSEKRKLGKAYIVTSQSPAGGTKAQRGSTVDLTIRQKTGLRRPGTPAPIQRG